MALSTIIVLLNDLHSWFSSFTALSVLDDGLSVKAIKALEDSRDTWQQARIEDFDKLLFVTKLVAVGVVMEGPELVHEVINVFRRWKGKVVPEHPPNWITAVGLLGWLVVLIGVAGEFWVDQYVNTDDENIQSANTALLRDAGSSAEKAKEASGIAVKQSDTATISSGKAIEEADSFEARIVAANQTAADAESHLADALQRAAHAESESAKSQAELAKLTGPPHLVPVKHGVAMPDLSFGDKQVVILTEDTRIILPKLPKGKSFSWTLILRQDDVGNHQITTSPKVTPENILVNPPRSSWVLPLITDGDRTIDTALGGMTFNAALDE